MNILLINDASLKPYFTDHTVLACGAKDAPYVMPGQSDFDFYYPDEMIQPVDSILSLLPQGFVPEMIIFSECYRNFFFLGIEKLECLLIWRPIDNHIHNWQPLYAPFFDLTFCAQKNHLLRFIDQTPFAYWLPLNLFETVHFNRHLERTIDVSFVGNMDPVLKPKRVEFIEKLKEKVPLSIFQNLNHAEMSEVYNRSKIVLNECMNYDLNYRFFEAMGNGALLLTPPASGLEDFFRDNSEVVLYSNYNAEECAEKISMILANWADYQYIAEAGEKEVHKNHTMEKRMFQMKEIISKNGITSILQRENRLDWNTYFQMIPIFVAFYTMKFSSFTGIAYLLNEMNLRNPVQTKQKCIDLIEHFGSQPISIELKRWVELNS